MTVLDLVMTAGGMDAESFSYSAERGTGARLDVTVIGDARGQSAPLVTVTVGGHGAAFAVPGTLPEWEAERNAGGWTTTLHATDRALIPQSTLPELVPWETREEQDARARQEQALQAARVPLAQRPAALRDGRRMAVDMVVAAALATVPHRLLVPAPFPGYDFRADGGPSYSTAGKTAQQVVQDLWGMLGLRIGWEDGVLVIRPPGPAEDLVLDAPVESERIERIALDAANIELEGGPPADPRPGGDAPPGPSSPGGDADGDGTSNEEDPDWTPEPGPVPDPGDPDSPDNSPDPDEREGNVSRGFAEGYSPAPQPGEVAATAVPLSWEAVPAASHYILERVEGRASAYTLWSRVAITTATRYTDDTVRPLTTYTYRLRVNATAIAGSETQNVIWQPSEWTQVTTPPVEVDAPPYPVTDLEGYARSSTAVGVKWTAPQADPPDKEEPPVRGPADRYRVDARATTPDATLLRRVETVQTWAVLDGLPVGGLIRVEVYAVNEQGDSEAAPLDVQLVNLPPAPASEPDLSTGDAQQSLTATWERASGALSYEVEYALAPVGTPEAGLAWRALPRVVEAQVPKDGEGGRPRAVLLGLRDAARYGVRVRARNDLGPGAWSPVAYELTEPELPQPEPDPEADAFESGRKSVLRLYRSTDGQTERTTIWKTGSRVDATRLDLWGDVPIYRREQGEDGERVISRKLWGHLKTTTARYMYEIPGWPLTLTASVEETVLYNTEAINGQTGIETGREQEKVHQEWSPQGWLNRRTTWRSKASVVKVQKNDAGEVTKREYGNMHETVREQWQPVGDGLWYYNRSGVMTTLLPTLVEDEWEDVEAGFKATPSETSVSEQAPPQATLPAKARESGPPPPLPRNRTSAALAGYPLDEPWFKTPASTLGASSPDPEEGGAEEAPSTPSPPERAPDGPQDPPPTPGGSGDPSGQPEPEAPRERETGSREPVRHTFRPPGATSSSPTVSAAIPWVRTTAALVRYGEMMAQQAGPRFRITRTYILPVQPPSLDAVESISASGSAGQFSMTVVTETR